MTSWEEKKVFAALAPVMGDAQSSQLYLSYLLSEGHERKRIVEKLQALAGKNLDALYKPNKLLPPPHPDVMQGPYRVGDVYYPERTKYGEVGLYADELRRHVMIAGMSGSGKTTLAVNIAKQLHDNHTWFWALDWKSSWPELLRKQGISDFVVFRIGATDSLKIDLFQPPPNVPLDRWLDVIILCLELGYYLSDGSEYILNQALGEFAPDQKKTIELWEYHVKKTYRRGRESIWRAPVLRALAKLTSKRCLGKTLNSTAPKHKLSELIGKNVIFDFRETIHVNDKVFMVSLLLNYLNEYMRTQSKRDKLLAAVFVEDAHNVFNKAMEERMSAQNILDNLLDESREFGLSVIVITLQPSKVSSSCKANTFCKISFNLGSGMDIKDISECMFLDQTETKAIDLLDIGQFLLKIKGRFHEPLFCTTKID